jgi:hypothetical protein
MEENTKSKQGRHLNTALISTYQCLRVFARRGRIYVALKNGNEAQVTMPRANYVWLKSNPSFLTVPNGYAVHHLDHDETNDDPSNLVIMYKHHHVAHHLKQITAKVEISFLEDHPTPHGLALTQPPKYQKHYKSWFVFIYNSEKKANDRFWRDYNGKVMRTEEQAKKFAEEILERNRDEAYS